MIRCSVIDDEPLAARLIASYVERTPMLELKGVYGSATDAVRDILAGDIDLVFLDIEMPQINGMEFAKIIPPTCGIVFTTAYESYAVKGFKVNAVDYLLKPVSYEEFLSAVQRFQSRMSGSAAESPRKEFMLVKSEYKHVQLRIADIELVECLKDYVKIYTIGRPKPVMTLIPIRDIEQMLPSDSFMRVHRSYIVNTRLLSVIERNSVVVGDHTVPVSDTYRPALIQYIDSLTAND